MANLKHSFVPPKASKDMTNQVMAIATYWNKVMRVDKGLPSLRIINQSHYAAISKRLGYFDEDEIIELIDFYSKRQWNLKNKSWRSILSYFAEPSARKDAKEDMLVKCEEEKKREQNKKQTPSPQIRPLTSRMSDHFDPVQIKLREEKAIFDKLKESGRQVAVIHQAINEVVDIYNPNQFAVAHMRAQLKELPDRMLRYYPQVRKQVLIILARTAPPPAKLAAWRPLKPGATN